MKIDTSAIEIMTLSSGEVTRAYTWDEATKSRSDRLDKKTGLPVWQIPAEVWEADDSNSMFVGNLKVVSPEEPKIEPRTVYKIEGTLQAVTYNNSSAGGRASVSLTVVGNLRPVSNGPKKTQAPA